MSEPRKGVCHETKYPMTRFLTHHGRGPLCMACMVCLKICIPRTVTSKIEIGKGALLGSVLFDLSRGADPQRMSKGAVIRPVVQQHSPQYRVCCQIGMIWGVKRAYEQKKQQMVQMPCTLHLSAWGDVQTVGTQQMVEGHFMYHKVFIKQRCT